MCVNVLGILISEFSLCGILINFLGNEKRTF